MNILSQSFQNCYDSEVTNSLNLKCAEYIAPLSSTLSSVNYGELISSLSASLHALGRNILKTTFEEMDLAFRNSPARTSKYYVKHTRYRTIVTVFGEVTYKRTEYIARATKYPYCYVDRKIHLRSRERYDSTIQSLIVETYANQNSMIKVGQLIGDRIGSSYSVQSSTSMTLPRQTVFNILHRLKSIHIPCTPACTTPETLYVMADEKYVYLQREDRNKVSHPKAMVKVAVVFEGRQKVSKQASIVRYQLLNPYAYASSGKSFWTNLHDQLNERYAMSKVKQIYLLGDGASWIESGASELSTQDTKVTFALDKFHAGQAIQRMSKDKKYTTLLSNYIINNMKEDFSNLVDAIIKNTPDRADKIVQQKDYLLNHWNHIQTMYKTVKIGCAIEQAIYHIIASVFSNVPKAYSRRTLETYISNRVHFQNRHNLRKVYLTAIDKKNNRDGTVTLKNSADFSFFDTDNLKPTYPLHLSKKNFKEITKF